MRLVAPVLVILMSLHSDHPSHAKPPEGHGHHNHAGRHGNPEDLDAYIAKLEDPARDEWQKPDEVLRALALTPGQTVCDIGAGSGYFALRAAQLVGPVGRVFAVDVEPRILDVLRDRIGKSAARNVTPVLALPDDALLPRAACDLILIINTFHHFPDGAVYLRRLVESVRPGGRIVNIDFHDRELPIGPPDHKVSREAFLKVAKEAGLELTNEPTFLPYQYFLVLRPR